MARSSSSFFAPRTPASSLARRPAWTPPEIHGNMQEVSRKGQRNSLFAGAATGTADETVRPRSRSVRQMLRPSTTPAERTVSFPTRRALGSCSTNLSKCSRSTAAHSGQREGCHPVLAGLRKRRQFSGLGSSTVATFGAPIWIGAHGLVRRAVAALLRTASFSLPFLLTLACSRDLAAGPVAAIRSVSGVLKARACGPSRARRRDLPGFRTRTSARGTSPAAADFTTHSHPGVPFARLLGGCRMLHRAPRERARRHTRDSDPSPTRRPSARFRNRRCSSGYAPHGAPQDVSAATTMLS